MYRKWLIEIPSAIAGLSCLCSLALAQPAPDEGRIVLLTRSYIFGSWAGTSYDQLWRAWGERSRPANFSAQLGVRYGLHQAPYDNDGLPMGLRRDGERGKLGIDCMLCHGGSILNESYIGLGNSVLDMQTLFEDLDKANGGAGHAPLPMAYVRGTVEAFNFTARLIALRTPSFRTLFEDFTLLDVVCEDIPAWWLLKKKKTMYYTGNVSVDSVRALMQFLLVPPTPFSTLDRSEADFARIRAYVLSLAPPSYPFPIDTVLARSGEVIFNKYCAECHGTYGPGGRYPNKIIGIDKIGTDRRLFDATNAQWRRRYNDSWFAKASATTSGQGYEAQATIGYQAPPLDGIWATAPYLHNGSVPTLYGILNSKTRPKVFRRSFRTGAEDFDSRDVGWKFQSLIDIAPLNGDPTLSRQIYDTTAPCRSNGGHTYSDNLTEPEQRAIVEYLKGI